MYHKALESTPIDGERGFLWLLNRRSQMPSAYAMTIERNADTVTRGCPQCQAAYDDTWEVLDADIVQAITCHLCHQPFYSLLSECPHCFTETIWGWSADEEAPALICTRCQSAMTPLAMTDVDRT